MPLKTPSQYIESLRELKLDLHLFGEKVTDWVDHPVIRPSINAVAMTYKVAGEPESKHLAVCVSSLSGERINRFNSLFGACDDLVSKVKLQRLLGQQTGSCFQRCVGMDAMNAVFSTTFEIDQACGTDYHKRFRRFVRYVQENDLMVQGAMTDAKGDRSKPPRLQDDPDMFVHIVAHKRDGVVIRGAKASQTGAANSHQILVMPTLRLQEGDEEYAICCALPIDSPGVHLIYGRQSCDGRKLEAGDIDVGNARFGGQETLTVFDDVFVPHERVFMCGEVDFSSMLVERFAAYHRQSYGGCKTGVADVLVGAAAQIAEYNGVAGASHIRDKIAEMTHLSESLYACGLACSYEGEKTAAGNYQPDILLANVCKLNVTRFPYEICRLAEDIAGGLLVTMPSEADLKHPEVGKYIQKYLKGADGCTAEIRMRMLALIHSIVSGTSAASFLTESMHGAGSPMAQKIMIMRRSKIEGKKSLARRLSGIDERETDD